MLIPVDECLLEQSELVVDPVTEARIVQRGHRVQETSGQAAKTTVAESGIRLQMLELFEILTELADNRLRLIVETEVREVVRQRPAHEELHGQVVDAFGVLLAIPALAVAHGVERWPADGNGKSEE